MITIVDYQTGNLSSVLNMLKKIGVPAEATSSSATIQRANKLILPGIGAFDPGMARLAQSGLIPLLSEKVLIDRIPTLGICLGMQLMTHGSEEGVLAGLGWIRASTVRFDRAKDPSLRIPHMGWNVVRPEKTSALLTECPDEARFYFTHSYYVRCDQPEDRLLAATHGETTFDAGFEHGNIYGVQFHPEKSHRFGMWLLKNFAERC